MLTLDFERLGLRPGDRVLDLGCGGGRHAFEAAKRGATVVALDRDDEPLRGVAGMFAAMAIEREVTEGALTGIVSGDALRLPFPDDSFDRVVASEVLEHIPDDDAAMAEVQRVLRPGGTLAVTVPRWLPELMCWGLSREYRDAAGGHVRIYRRSQLCSRLRATGFEPYASHHAHGLHSPYWWLRCLIGPRNDRAWPVRAYHRFLVWEMSGPPPARALAAAADPLMGKSLVVYLRAPDGTIASR